MGLFSWFSNTLHKSKAAATVQTYFEVSQRLGTFSGDPAMMANRVVELAFNRVPDLANGRFTGYVLGAAVLTIIVMEPNLALDIRDQCGMALAGMLKAAEHEGHLHSYEDQAMLQTARKALAQFRELVPSPPISEVLRPATPKVAAVKHEQPETSQDRERRKVAAVKHEQPETSQDRERRMEELIKKMKSE